MTIKRRIAEVLFKPNSVKKAKKACAGSPESWWIQQKNNVVGRMTQKDMLNSRQIDTYRAVFDAITARSLHEVADLGCNTAALGMLLYAWGYTGKYTGVDSNPYALKVAEENLRQTVNPCTLVNGNIRTLPFEDARFECVLMKDVLEHMEDFRPVLSEAMRVSSGSVMIANFIPWTEGRKIVRREDQGYYHNLYNRKEVYDFAATYGFHVEEVISALEADARSNEVVIFSRRPKKRC